MRVAIDGPAGSGKSTVARAIAARCGLTYLDTGAMYRAVTWKCLADGIPVGDMSRVAALARDLSIEFGSDTRGQTVQVDGDDVTAAIRTPGVDHNVSAVSAIPAVREAMVFRQRQMAAEGDVVAEGRDIGTVVFPDAEVKVFLTADAAARAHRRAVQREGLDAATDAHAAADAHKEQQVLDDLLRRDAMDSSREIAPLRPAEDACHIDSSNKTVDEVVDQIVAMIDAARRRARRESDTEVDRRGIATSQPSRAARSGDALRKENTHTTQRSEQEFAKPLAKPHTTSRMRAWAGNTLDDYRDHAMRDYPRPAKLFIGFVVGLLALVTKILWPWHFEDSEKLWAKEPARVIVMNHVSMLEPVCVYVSLYMHGIRCRFISKSEFDHIKPLSWLLSRAGAIPVKRGTADLKAVRRAEQALKRGECVFVFPEGTRVRADDQPAEIHGGFALIAQLGHAPVQPAAVVGARDITPAGKHYKRLFHRVYLKVGDLITFDEVEGKGRKAKAAAMEKLAMERVYELRDELRREHPGKI